MAAPRKSAVALGVKHTTRVSARRLIKDTVESKLGKKSPASAIVVGALTGFAMNLLK